MTLRRRPRKRANSPGRRGGAAGDLEPARRLVLEALGLRPHHAHVSLTGAAAPLEQVEVGVDGRVVARPRARDARPRLSRLPKRSHLVVGEIDGGGAGHLRRRFTHSSSHNSVAECSERLPDADPWTSGTIRAFRWIATWPSDRHNRGIVPRRRRGDGQPQRTCQRWRARCRTDRAPPRARRRRTRSRAAAPDRAPAGPAARGPSRSIRRRPTTITSRAGCAACTGRRGPSSPTCSATSPASRRTASRRASTAWSGA